MTDNYGVVSESRCPCCGRVADCATCPTDESAVPVPGDWTVCIGCGAALVFDEALRMRWPRPDEEAPAELEPMRAAVHKMREKKP